MTPKKRLLGFVIWIVFTLLMFTISSVMSPDNILVFLIVFGLGFVSWIIVKFLSYPMTIFLFQIQRVSLFHLRPTIQLFSYNDFFLSSRKQSHTKIFIILILTSVAFSIHITNTILPYLSNDEFYDDSILIQNDAMLKISISLLIFPIIVIFVYGTYLLDLSNLRLVIKETHTITASSSIFRVFFGFAALYSLYSVSSDIIFKYLDQNIPFLIGFGIMYFFIIFTTAIIVAFMFLHFSEENLSKKFQKYLHNKGIKEKQIDLK